MKPRVHSKIEYTLVGNVRDGVRRVNPRRIWIVEFDDCGREEEWFAHFTTALRFAHHVAKGGERWDFFA